MGLPMSDDIHLRHVARREGLGCWVILCRGREIGQVSFLPEEMPRHMSTVVRRICLILDEVTED